MPANNPRQPRRSWKDDKPTGDRRGHGQRGWHKEPAAPGVKGPWLSRRGKIALAVTGLLLGIGAIAAFMLMPRAPDPPRLVLIGAGYETNPAVPANVAGVHALDQLQDWAEHYKGPAGRIVEHKRAVLAREGDPFDGALTGTPETVVVYVAVHGAADSNGPYLIPNDADPRNNAYTAYRLNKLFDALKRLPKTKKLLILDSTGVESDPALSLLHNDFTRALREGDRAISDVPNLAVLVASAEDQRSWVSEEWGTSIFAHFVVEGLKGDEAPNRVTAKSLADYVTKKVIQWSHDNRPTVQTPVLLGNTGMCDDFTIAVADKAGYKAPDPAALPAFTEPPGLRAAWKARGDLEASRPSPAACAPLMWRQYLDTLKRYEDLLRAGDTTGSAATMAASLNELGGRIAEAQHAPRGAFAALANNLGIPAAFGSSLKDSDLKRTERDFYSLWATTKAAPDYARKLQEWQGSVSDPSERQLLRLRMNGLLLHKGLESGADFATACTILADPGIKDAVPPYRPAEAHFALMLNTFLPKEGRNWAQTQKALDVRLQAEEAALGMAGADTALPAYSEQVLPWIRSEIERADAERRRGEDLSFAPARRADADRATQSAQQDYSQAQNKAAVVRRALAARDEAFVRLPYYTGWLGTLPLKDEEVERYGELWDAVHRLGALLEQPAFDKIDALVKPTAEVNDGLKEVKARFDQAAQTLPRQQTYTQSWWAEVNNLLQVPFLDAEPRMELLVQLRDASHRLNADKPSGVTDWPKLQQSQAEMKSGQRRGRLALAALGKHNPAVKDAEQAITRPDEGAWGRSLARAGERIGGAYQEMAAKVYADTEKGRQEPLKDARTTLHQAASQSQQLSGAAVAAWAALDPIGENRRVELHDLLVYEGRRTFADYWAGDDPKHPYYRDAGDLYRSAAATMAGGDPNLTLEAKKARLAETEQFAALLAQDDTLTPRWFDGPTARPGPAILYVTDEDRVPRAFRLDKAAAAPDGIPVVWTEIGTGLRPAQPQDLERRAVVRDRNEPGDTPIEYELIADHPKVASVAKEQTTYTFTAFFRGRRETLPTTVWLYHRPEVTSYQPEFPTTARLAIKSSQRDYDRFAAAKSELVIVVDYSFSMTKMTKGSGGKKSRKQEALDALELCLKQVPKGVKVTLLTFSSKSDGRRIVAQWNQVPWDPAAEAVRDRIDQLRRLEPTYDTPLVRATVEAKEKFSKGFRGAKSVLVLTDGGDNYFLKGRYTDLAIKKNDKMADYLRREFDGSGVLVNVIGIETDYLDPKEDQEEIDGLAQYKPAIEAIGGTFVSVKDTAKLADQIERYLLQIHYRVEGREAGKESGRVPAGAIPEDGADVSRRQENYRWIKGLIPGTFMVSLQTNRLNTKAIEQRVRLEGGDALVLQLQPAGDGTEFVLRREQYAESYGVKNLNKVLAHQEPDKEWLVSVLQNQREETGRPVHPLHVMTVIEKRDHPDATSATALGLARPRFVWFNIGTKDAPGKVPAGGLRFYPLADYPAAAYAIDLPEWTRGKESVADVWWTEETPPDCDVLRPEGGKRLMDVKQLEREVRPTNQADRTRVVVESIAYERRTAEVKPKDFRPDVDCVVVRLRWDPDVEKGKAFFASLPDELQATGAEHRFYLEAGKYTGIFFNVTKEKLQSLERLTLYSVEGAKLNAHKVTGLTIGAPNTDDRPQKPQD
jgi:hypothetical protein